MKKITCNQVHLHKKEILDSRCIFISGSDAFQKDNCFKYIINLLNPVVHNNSQIDNGISAFLFYGVDYSTDEHILTIMDTINMLSFDLSEIIISIKYLESLKSKAIAKLVKYTENPNPYAKLILVSDAVDGRLTMYKTLKENCLNIETTDMKYQKDLLIWLDDYIRTHNLIMERQVKDYFTTIVVPDAYIAYNEMQKLEIYIGKRKTITIDDIKECTVNTKTSTIFEFLDAIGFRQTSKALTIAENLINNLESIIMINTMLTNFFYTLWRLDALRRKGISQRDLISKHMDSIINFKRDNYIRFLLNYNTLQIQNALKNIYICDCRAKLSMADDKVLITSLVMSL